MAIKCIKHNQFDCKYIHKSGKRICTTHMVNGSEGQSQKCWALIKQSGAQQITKQPINSYDKHTHTTLLYTVGRPMTVY